MDRKQIAIAGATGYTGSELMRLLTYHPNVDIVAITSESRAGERFSDIHASFTGIADQVLIPVDRLDDFQPDLVFLALPHGVAMDYVKRFRDRPFRLIDLSGDFRLESASVYEDWYQTEHVYPEGFERAVFGLPELFAEEIKDARLVANPGCYPTGAILGVAPLLAGGLISTGPIIVDSKSGVTGAGVKPKAATHFPGVNDNFRAYNLKRHRHSIEIQGVLDRVAQSRTTIQFSPHLLPVDRGILSTIYAQPSGTVSDKSLAEVYREYYRDQAFVRVRSHLPTLKDVRGTNYCDVYSTFDDRTGVVIVISVIDNLVKGAAGQAIQNMNIMFGWDHTTGLKMAPVSP